MAEHTLVARSPIAQTPPTAIVAGWEVSARRSDAALRLVDCTPLTKVLLHGAEDGAIERSLGVAHAQAARDDSGHLVIGSGPGEWLVLAPPGTADAVVERLRAVGADAGEFHAVVDLTHGRALMRLTGTAAASTLAKVCGIDLADDAAPNGTAFRSSVARLVTDVVRDDRDGVPAYLLHCERSSGQYLFDALLDAGGEYGIAVDGFPTPEI